MSPKPKSLMSCSHKFSKWWYKDLNSFHLGDPSSSACSFQGIMLMCIKQANFERTELMTRHKSPLCSHPLVRTRSKVWDTGDHSLLGFMNWRNWSGDQLADPHHGELSYCGYRSRESLLPFLSSVLIWGVKKPCAQGFLTVSLDSCTRPPQSVSALCIPL